MLKQRFPPLANCWIRHYLPRCLAAACLCCSRCLLLHRLSAVVVVVVATVVCCRFSSTVGWRKGWMTPYMSSAITRNPIRWCRPWSLPGWSSRRAWYLLSLHFLHRRSLLLYLPRLLHIPWIWLDTTRVTCRQWSFQLIFTQLVALWVYIQ